MPKDDCKVFVTNNLAHVTFYYAKESYIYYQENDR